MKFKTRRFLFIAIVIAVCLPISVLYKTIIAVPLFEALLLDFNEFCYERGEQNDKPKKGKNYSRSIG